MSKHTPGPWRIKDDKGTIVGPDEQQIEASGLSLALGYRDEEDPCFANARLISAAPEMLEALEAARQFIENGVEYGFIRMPTTADPALVVLPMIRAAIAKAKGDTP